LEPVPLEVVRAMLSTCGRDLLGCRDRAVIMALLDTGCRASEFLRLDIGDVNFDDGSVLVRQSKSRRPRVVFLGARSRRALLRYLRMRDDGQDSARPLWTARDGRRLRYAGLRDILRRRARRAGVAAPTLHAFRRAFALCSLRGGADVYSLQRMMGHADLSVLRRYLAQSEADLAAAHRASGPVDHML